MQQNTSILPKQITSRNNVNQYEKALMSDRNVIKSNSQMEQWSILSDNIVYVKSEDNDVMKGIDIKSIDTEITRECIERWVNEKENSLILTSEKSRNYEE